MSVSSSDASQVVRGAVAQTAPEIGASQRNLAQVIDQLGEAAASGAKLVVFPECALSGYLFDDVETCAAYAERIPGIG